MAAHLHGLATHRLLGVCCCLLVSVAAASAQFIDSADYSDAWPMAQLRPQQPPAGLGVLGPAPASQLGQLAKSPASSLLASEFFAAERRRQAVGGAARQPHQQQVVGAATTLNINNNNNNNNNLSLWSEQPVYSASLEGAFRLDEYHRLEDIYSFVDALGRRYKGRVHVFSVGQTAEGRPIKALELINNATDADFVWLDALTHAREWITGSTLLYTIDRLVAGPAASTGDPAPHLGRLAYHKNYIIIPVVNPDGYAYTWSTNRMWRKNRSKSAGAHRGAAAAAAAAASNSKQCLGADLNRNYGHLSFGGEGASADPCSHIYSGPAAFSERETRALADLMWSLRDRLKFYLTMHSFNQLWACPYAHTTDQPAHLQTHLRVLRSVQRAVEEAEGVHYEVGPLSTSLYVGSGFGIDFAYDHCGVVHSYLVELRDRGAHGFVLPPDQIMPTARETFAGLRAGLRAAFGSPSH